MYLTGFADEAATDLTGQIEATKALGWNAIESRAIDGTNIHDLDDAAFDRACDQLAAAQVRVNCFGSTIANWSKQVDDPFDITLAEVDRAIPRMRRLGCGLIRIMSYARRDDDDQMLDERCRRLREIVARFLDAGITPVHENCMNYGGMSWRHTMELIDNVPGLKLAFDTGNPAVARDWSKPEETLQDPLEFCRQIQPHIAYVHIKDAKLVDGEVVYTYPGDGAARIPEILKLLADNGYDGGLSIEPHMASVFHDPDAGQAAPEEARAIYLEYGRRLQACLSELGIETVIYRPADLVTPGR